MNSSFAHAGLLNSLKSRFASHPSACFLVPLLVSTTLGKGAEWLPHIYASAVKDLPETQSTSRTQAPVLPSQETNARRRVVREIKEALVKTSILIGVPRVIEALLELGSIVPECDKDDSFVRQSLVDDSFSTAAGHGEQGLRKIYRRNLDDIWKRMEPDMRDVKFYSQYITYGTFLTPFGGLEADASPDPLAHDPALLSVVTLSCLAPQRTPREILWHLRGALRNGMTRDEVETLQATIEEVCTACGVEQVGKDMPRVVDVEKEQ